MSRKPLVERVNDALALITGTHTIRCPYPGCRVSVRYRRVTPDEAKRLTGLATAHTHH
ncbi:hypothetical protein [Streptomyces sp. NPDC090112]|uniref:hypothetical protein n=1 Tax=Streptomyces sp. NPDC090112 TaxID=3365949 RepID=UPI0037FD46EF